MIKSFFKQFVAVTISSFAILSVAAAPAYASTCDHDWQPVYKTVSYEDKFHEEDQGSGESIFNRVKEDFIKEWALPCLGCECYITTTELQDSRIFKLFLRHDVTHPGGYASGGSVEISLAEIDTAYYSPLWTPKIVTVVDEAAHTEKTIVGYYCTKCCAEKSA